SWPSSRSLGTSVSLLLRRLTAKVAWPVAHSSRAGINLPRASPTTATSLPCSDCVYCSTRFSCSASKKYIARRLLPTTGPEWVCDAASIIASRGRRYLFLISSHTATDSSRGMPTRSIVTNTQRRPPASSSANALAHRSCNLPSAGLVRLEYPDIHIGL